MCIILSLMETIDGWCREWGSVYQYMFSASVRARSIAKLTFDGVDDNKHIVASQRIAHERSLSTKKLLCTSTMEDRSIAYERVYRLCCKPRVCTVSATAIVQHLLDMSLRWWLHWFCNEVNAGCRKQVFPVDGPSAGSSGVYEHPAWKNADALFHDIEVDVALRTALRGVLMEIEHSVTGQVSASKHTHESRFEDNTNGYSLSSVAVTIHAISTLSRHCLFLERVLFVQFLTLNRASEGIIAKILRRAVRDLLERPFTDDTTNDIISQITLALVACAREAIFGSGADGVSDTTSVHAHQLQQSIALGKVALIFTLVDASGLSLSLNDTCTVFERICFDAGVAAIKNSVREVVETASNPGQVNLSLLSAASMVSKWLDRRTAVSQSLSLMLQASVTTIFTTKVVDLARERHYACLLNFDAGSTDGALPSARELVEMITPVAFEAFANISSEQLLQKREPLWCRYWETFAASEIASFVRTSPARYLFPALVKFCECSDHLMEALQVSISCAVRVMLQSHALGASVDGNVHSKGQSDQTDQLQLDAIFVNDFLTSTRAAFVDLVPSCSLTISQAVLNGVSEFLRAHEHTSVMSLVNDFHRMISVEGVRDGVCPQDVLEALVSVVSLLPAKDVFVARYGESVGRRLLLLHASGTWSPDCSGGEVEMEVIHTLSGRIGAATCAPLTAILRDFRSVGNFTRSEGEGAQHSDSLAVRVIELCMVRWKGQVVSDLLRRTTFWKDHPPRGFLGHQLRDMCAAYEHSQNRHRSPSSNSEDHRGATTPSRQLHWAMCSGSLTLHCYFPQATSGFKEIVLQCPPYVALVLDAMEASFAQQPSGLGTSGEGLIRFDDICALSTPLSSTLVRSVMVCLTAVGMIRKSADGTQFGFISNSLAKHRRMKVNPMASMAQSKFRQPHVSANASTVTPIDTALAVERQRKTEACIVRIMKSARQLSHADLLMKCAQILSPQFEVTISLFKTCVAEMIAREYLKRVEMSVTNEVDAEEFQPHHHPGYEYVA
ncbi:Hypothetical protein, putative [Bodo saltans]|uniref:Cullin neddylation domain-containing protein n=1 Tax=Bodo saltans TaxID=75058 RepID=A0A0S4JSY8_BODSA|nr:Hypothetical protein, putative [Bodo saltans]|eukprot:CUG93387.1 Hypothetical protein, putative [Bodo saltans]